MRLLHASGFDPASPQRVTAHDRRLDAVDSRRVAALLERYAQALLAAGQREAAALPWGWSRFADGTPVPRMAGEVLATLGPEGERFRRDPLATGSESFRAWLASPVDGERPRITRLWPACTRSAAISAKRSRTRSAPTARPLRAGSRPTGRASTASRSARRSGWRRYVAART